ncbi:uncharacterized protein LOC118439105 [Folsomia candida]|uniref:DUF4806 domain-containing protein n=1 Tax=Folsomia candida TaxID=158441 RepID=A0A226EN97_FOLCA|nr:uncharacterized protein LOC118434431 [Folsomia candida]XP_035716029.1 uncharacterized protein LOC118439105 [Folsomia candida]OXA41289.1 hypothetical protein Fcan01_24157 [Folsomia candida]OXA59112.1 hypothetical protein Fcan01_06132 [Folsomia candida]
MNFLVVEFPTDNPKTVDVIPQTWLISKTQCYWPTRCLSTNLTKIRREQVKPDRSWGKCACRILGHFETFEAAQQAAVLAENTSDLDINFSTKRSTHRRPESSSDSTDDEGPPIKAKKITKSVINSVPQTLFKLGDLADVTRAQIDQGLVLSGNNEERSAISNVETDSSGSQILYMNATPSGDGQLNLAIIPNDTNVNQDDQSVNFGSHPIYSSPVPSPSANLGLQTQGFNKVVLKHLAAIKTGQKSILEKLDLILNNQNRIGVGLDLNTETEEPDFSSLPIFPLESVDALEQLESQLAIDDERKLFVLYLIDIGGKSLGETVKRILQRIVSEDLAIDLSYTGLGKNKKPFNIYKHIVNCITAATKKNKRLPAEVEKTEFAIREIVMDFFRYSRPRKAAASISQDSTD